ncbi:MAG: hypothetical protein SVW57_01370 [Thermodesulfobacteriota bacterium]|nr:hypothetical protein [Thermodesulfobacteriota bacterium]
MVFLIDSRDALFGRKNYSNLLREQLCEKILDILVNLGKTADELSYNVYLVGGIVRDLILEKKNYDIDVVIEGDGIYFVQEFSRRYPCMVKYYKRFKTATLTFPLGYKVDAATARSEYYEKPASAPKVKISSLRKDLFRRDFTINTLAIGLNPGEFGELIDFFNAERDIQEGIVRVIHKRSFVEDPSRVYRAIRFEQRFGFQLEKQTQKLIEDAVQMRIFDKLSGRRLLTEIQYIFEEDTPLRIIERMETFDLLKFIHPNMKLDKKSRLLFEHIQEVCLWYNSINGNFEKLIVYLLILLDQLRHEEVESMCERFTMPKRLRDRIVSDHKESRVVSEEMSKIKRVKNSQIYQLLSSLSTECLLFSMAKADHYRKNIISLFLTKLRFEKVLICGNDLKFLGIKPGKIYKEIFTRLLHERLDGNISTRDDELNYVKKHYRCSCRPV